MLERFKLLLIEKLLATVKDAKVKNRILTLAVAKLFSTISKDDILTEKDGTWFYRDKALSSGEKSALIAEATQFTNTKLWNILQSDIRYKANKSMFLLAENEQQLTSGKLWLYTLDCIKTRLESMSRGSGFFNKEE